MKRGPGSPVYEHILRRIGCGDVFGHEEAIYEGVDRILAGQINKGRLAYTLSLIGSVDVEDSDEGWRAYADLIVKMYSFTDLDDDPDYERIAGSA